MIIAAIPRPAGNQLVVSIEQNDKDGSSYILFANVRADETISHRAPLRPSEIKQVVAALTLAAQTLVARKPQHRTISGAELDAETKRLF